MVKIISLSLICFLITAIAKSQFNINQKILSGNIGFSTGKQDNLPVNFQYTSKYSNIHLNPSYGSFITPNQLAGFNLSFNRNKQTNKNSNNTYVQSTEENAVGLNVFKEHFFPLPYKFYFTIKGSAGASYRFGKVYTTSNSQISEDKKNGYGVGFGLTPGISYRITERFLFDLSLSNFLYAGYGRDVRKNVKPGNSNNRYRSQSLFFSSSFSNTNLGNVGIGLRWLLKN